MFGLKILSKLNQKKYRSKYGCFIVEGKKGVLEAIDSGKEIIQLVMTRKFAREEEDFGGDLEKFIVEDREFDRLVETVTPSGIAAVIKMPTFSLADVQNGSIIAVLEDIRDPGNLGTMIRTADWFDVDGILLIGGADPYQSKVVRASMGSIFHLPLITSQDVQKDLLQLKRNGFQIVVTRPELAQEKTSQTLDKNHKMALVFGNESQGTSRTIDELADRSLSIPKYGKAESLNVAISFGILLSQLKTS